MHQIEIGLFDYKMTIVFTDLEKLEQVSGIEYYMLS